MYAGIADLLIAAAVLDVQENMKQSLVSKKVFTFADPRPAGIGPGRPARYPCASAGDADPDLMGKWFACSPSGGRPIVPRKIITYHDLVQQRVRYADLSDWRASIQAGQPVEPAAQMLLNQIRAQEMLLLRASLVPAYELERQHPSLPSPRVVYFWLHEAVDGLRMRVDPHTSWVRVLDDALKKILCEAPLLVEDTCPWTLLPKQAHVAWRKRGANAEAVAYVLRGRGDSRASLREPPDFFRFFSITRTEARGVRMAREHVWAHLLATHGLVDDHVVSRAFATTSDEHAGVLKFRVEEQRRSDQRSTAPDVFDRPEVRVLIDPKACTSKQCALTAVHADHRQAAGPSLPEVLIAAACAGTAQADTFLWFMRVEFGWVVRLRHFYHRTKPSKRQAATMLDGSNVDTTMNAKKMKD